MSKKKEHLVHRGETTLKVPAKTALTLNDKGEYTEEVIEPEREIKAKVPVGTRFGAYEVGIEYEVEGADLLDHLRRRGFVDATQAEQKSGRSKTATEEEIPETRIEAARIEPTKGE
jgi:hypothetical protein